MNNKLDNTKVLLHDGRLCDKKAAHILGLMHYAFSVFIFNNKNELLIQKREKGKYHSGGLWSNTCCGHPLTFEISNIKKYAEIRLQEEMGFTCKLYYIDKIEYKVKCGPLLENEDDHIFVGFSEGPPHINKLEVENYRWVDSQFLVVELNNCANEFSEWFKIIIKSNILKEYLK